MDTVQVVSNNIQSGLRPSRRIFLGTAATIFATPASTLKLLAAPVQVQEKHKTQQEKYQGPNSKDFYPTGEARTEWREWNQRASELLNNQDFFKGLEMQKLKDGSKVVKLSLKNIHAMKNKLTYDQKQPIKYVFARGINDDKSSYTLFFVRDNDHNAPLIRVRPMPLTGKEEEKAFNIYQPDFSAATVTKKDGVLSLKYDIVNADEVPLRFDPSLGKNGTLIASPEVMKIQENFSTEFKESNSIVFRDTPVMTIASADERDPEIIEYKISNKGVQGKREHPLWDLDPAFARYPRKIEEREDGMMAYVQEPLLGKKYNTDPNSKGPKLVGGKIDKETGALIPERTGTVRHNRQILNHKLSKPELLDSDKQIGSFYLEF
jgi:hypothetical protein